MIAGSVEPAILALGVGNQLLSDDGVGLVLLQELSRHGLPGVECVDGGTQGLMLLGQLAGRSAVILFDAIRLGAPPGTVHSIPHFDLLNIPAGGPTSHEANAGDLLRAATLTGDLPERVFVIGIEPDRLSTGIGLSEKVEAAVPAAVKKAIAVIQECKGRDPAKPYRTGTRDGAKRPCPPPGVAVRFARVLKDQL